MLILLHGGGISIGKHRTQYSGFPPSETFDQLIGIAILGCSAHGGPVHFARSGSHLCTIARGYAMVCRR